MDAFGAISMGVVAGCSLSPHNLFLSYISHREPQKAPRVLAGGIATDLIIIALVSLGLMAAYQNVFFQILSFIGKGFILMIGYKLFGKSPKVNSSETIANYRVSFGSGMFIQALNPYPYLFWMGVFFPAAKTMTVPAAVISAGTFLVTTYFIKWLVFSHLTQVLSAAVRLWTARTAFVLFAVRFFS